MEQYDMSALYLYNDGYGHRIGRISKVNEKSVRMEYGVKLDIETFKNIHKLNDEEIAIANREIIKKLADTNRSIRNMLENMKSLKSLLNDTIFACVDSEKLQNEMDTLTVVLANELKAFNINGKDYKFELYSERVSEVKEA